MKRYYTILLGNKIFEGGIADMNTSAIWSEHGMVWTSYKKALTCLKYWANPKYGIETKKKKLSVKELYF